MTGKAPPEFSATEITSAHFRAALEEQGCVVIRGLLSVQTLRHVSVFVNRAYERWDKAHEQGSLPANAYTGMYRFGHVSPEQVQQEAGWTEPGDLVRHTIGSSALVLLLQDYFQAGLGFLLKNCVPRRQKCHLGPNPPVPFHQDAVFLGNRYPVLNCWIPLVPCGRDAPGLEVVRAGLDELIKPDHFDEIQDNNYERIGLEASTVSAMYPSDLLWHPQLNVSDVMVFSHFTIHRTYVTEQMTVDRSSLEFRCTAMHPQLASRADHGLFTIERKSG